MTAWRKMRTLIEAGSTFLLDFPNAMDHIQGIE
jgi:hypothetical protein